MIRARIWHALAAVLALPVVVDAIIRYAQRRPYSHLYSYMGRWWVMPRVLLGRDEFGALFPWRWLPCSIRLHHILREDADPYLHDHPWPFRTIILRGWYQEEDIFGEVRVHLAGDTVARSAKDFHRITRVSNGGVWTLFIMGRRRNRWGFLTGYPARKTDWKEYESPNHRASLVSGDREYRA